MLVLFFGCKFLELPVLGRKVSKGDVWEVWVFQDGSAYVGSSLSFTGVRFVVWAIQFVEAFH